MQNNIEMFKMDVSHNIILMHKSYDLRAHIKMCTAYVIKYFTVSCQFRHRIFIGIKKKVLYIGLGHSGIYF